jgi:hypothetical protein
LPGIDAGGQDSHWTVQRQVRVEEGAVVHGTSIYHIGRVEVPNLWGFLFKLIDFDRPLNFPLEYLNHIMKVGLHLGPDPRILGSETPPPPWTLLLDSRLDNVNSVGYNDIHGRNQFVQIAFNREKKIMTS